MHHRTAAQAPLPLIAFLAALALAVAGCGTQRTPAARGEPEVVARTSPDRTFQSISARVEAAAPDASSQGEVRLDSGYQRLTVVGRGAHRGYPELEEPLAVVDLVRGAGSVVSYGGTAVRGASTFRYQLVISTEQAVAATPPIRQAALRAFVDRLGVDRLGAPLFYADVWIDDQGRLRRIQLPVEKTTRRPVRRESPQLVTVDLFDFK